jgi:acetolactate synthase-1/2/3 large subunit
MKQEVEQRTGAQLLVDALKVHGVDHAFCVPGESYLAVLDALYDARDAIHLTVARQDGGAAYMAEGYGKLTGKPGICLVTRGPGAANASIAVHTAHQDSTPMILFIGQVGSDFVEREAFQEIDYRRMFGQMAKWVASIDRADRVPEYVSHAFHCAMSGRKGPVVLALPEDMLTATAAVPDTDPYREVQAHPGATDIDALRSMLAAASRPIVIAGGSGWNERACADLQRFAEANGLPVGCAFRFQDVFDNRHPHYAGDVGIGINPKLAARIKEADLVLAIGPRLGEMTTGGYTLLIPPRPAQKLVHVHAGAEELGRVYQGDLLINAGMPQIAAALAAMPAVDPSRFRVWTEDANADYREWSARRENPGRVQMWDVVDHLKRVLPADAILANGAGNFSGWFHRFYPHTRFRTQVAPTSGAMGYGAPAAVACKIAAPERVVLSINGDGDYLMNGQEIATAVQYDAAVIFIVVNNGMYGTIRMHQEREYPARVYGTALRNPDFAAYARAFGAHGETVEETAQFAPALERCLASGKPSLIEIRLDPEAITTQTTIAAIRAKARAAKETLKNPGISPRPPKNEV